MAAPARRGPAAMPAIDIHAPVLGSPGEPCSSCGTPLAADQRYCLNCGERRGPRRLDPHAHAGGRGSAGAAPPAPTSANPAGPPLAAAARPSPPRGWPLPSPRVAGVATLLVLGFGIVAGAAAGPQSDATLASARRTIVVGPPPAAAPVAQQPASTESTPPDTSTSTPDDSASTDSSSTDTSTSPDVSASTDTSGTDSSGTDTSGTDTSGTDTSGDTSGDSSGDTGDGSTTADGGGDTSTTGDGDTSATTGQADVKHVWLVALTAHDMQEALADPSPMPYLSGTLRPKGLLLSNYKVAGPGAAANLAALISGQKVTPELRGNCPAYNDLDPKARTGCVYAKDVDTIQGQLTTGGKTWRAYVEDSDAGQPPDTCRHPAPGGALEPVMARNPLLFFHSIVDTTDCAANIAGVSRIAPDAQDADSAPTFSLVIPNACHDGADQPCAPGAPAGAGAADAWLKEQLDPLMASKAYKDGGMVVVLFDTAPDLTKALGALIVSDAVEAGGTDEGDYRPANLLRTFEDLFTLDPLARAKDVHAVSITKPSR